ncbi:MAG: aldehyde dehydrogenase family protein [Saprospiraceae bacterium]|nr:aldehyde dehydrogenase family protein [Saprospiraceae bacterium]
MKRTFKIISPGSGEVFAERPYATNDLINATLERAGRMNQVWKETPLGERIDICQKAVDYFVRNADPWGEEITRMMGRPIRYSPYEIKGGFQERARYMIDIAPEMLSEIRTRDKEGFQRFIQREPLGTILVLAPWNYPYLTSVNVVIPALLAGNSVILKHSEQTAICAERYLEAFEYAGLPAGVFQYLHLDHAQVASLINEPQIAYVAFTGSVEGGRAIQSAVGKRFITAGLELGGKDPAYICEDADWNYTIDNVVDGSFFNSGQSCCAIERIYVQQSVYERFIEDFVNLTKKYVLGDPLDPATTLGPMVRKSNAELAKVQLSAALKAGARPQIPEGTFPNLPTPYLAPQVLTSVDHQMEVMTEESFAPIIGIMPVANDAEAIRLMNDSQYGLTASIWTSNMDRALQIGNEVDTGTWFMNRCDYLDPELAWTGVKNTGKGCTLSRLGYEHLTRPKSFHLKYKTQ